MVERISLVQKQHVCNKMHRLFSPRTNFPFRKTGMGWNGLSREVNRSKKETSKKCGLFVSPNPTTYSYQGTN